MSFPDYGPVLRHLSGIRPSVYVISSTGPRPSVKISQPHRALGGGEEGVGLTHLIEESLSGFDEKEEGGGVGGRPRHPPPYLDSRGGEHSRLQKMGPCTPPSSGGLEGGVGAPPP